MKKHLSEQEHKELETLNYLLKIPVYSELDQLSIWTYFRALLHLEQQETVWIYYLKIQSYIYILHYDSKNEIEHIFHTIQSKFPVLTQKYELLVKNIRFTPARMKIGLSISTIRQ